MLKLVEVANYLTNQLNAIGETHDPAYTFNIQAEVGANKNAADVQGIVKTAKPKIAPVLNARNVTYNLLVELSIVAPTTNYNLKNIEEIVNSFASQVNGQEIAFENGKGLVTMTLGQAGTFKQESGQGNIVPLSYDLQIVYTEGVATSRSKHWLLDNIEIPYLSESILISKEGRTNKVNGKKYNETFALGQQKRYRFTFLYDETSVLCQNLQKDILDGHANKTYELKYYDNVYYTQQNPYTTTVVLFETGDTKSQKPDVAQFDITFADADDGQGITKYYLALLDNPFDEATENTKCFSDTVENGVVTATAYENQIAYYNDLIINQGVPENEIPAPNISSVYLTNQTYVNVQNTDLFKIVNKNYARIRVATIENGVAKNYYFYYWTKNPAIGMEGQVTFDLKMDSLQTYLFQDNIKFEGNFIERASLNRWVDNGDGTVSFDGSVTSKLFERENLKQVAKRLVTRQKLNIEVDTTPNSYLNEWINDHVYAWVYIYVSAQNYIGASQRPTEASRRQALVTTPAIEYVKQLQQSATHIDGAVGVYCYPITDGSSLRVYYQKSQNEWRIANIESDVFSSFVELNNGFSNVYSIKLSVKPPFPKRAYVETTEVSPNLDADYYTDYGSQITLIANAVLTNDMLYGKFKYSNFGITGVGDQTYGFLINVTTDYMTPIDVKMQNILPPISFNKTSIVGSMKNPAFNPKLNNSDYKELNLSFVASSESYDIQKLNNATPSFEYYEPLASDITKGLVQYHSVKNNEVYGSAYSESYNGLSYTNDLSLSVANNQLSQYLANNKNAYLSFQNQQERQKERAMYGLLGTVAGGAVSALTGGILKTVAPKVASNSSGGSLEEGMGSAVQTGINYVATLRDQEYQTKQFNMTLDDMRSAPNVLQNVNGSSILATSVSQLGVYAEIYEALPHELEMANDDMFMNGFTYNIDDDIFPYINQTNSVHIRANFNYLQAVIGNISGITISNEARNDLRQRLATGVRFWHINQIDYQHENYEKWLEA